MSKIERPKTLTTRATTKWVHTCTCKRSTILMIQVGAPITCTSPPMNSNEDDPPRDTSRDPIG